MSYQSMEALMQHLRDNGIAISDAEKRKLMNSGYFHGYKGYRFFGSAKKRIPFSSYSEISATIEFDTKLKSLLYDKIMYIETAVKNIALECIMQEIGSETIQDLFENAISSYKNAAANSSADERKRLQSNKLSLQQTVHMYLLKEYKNNNPKITHFYNKGYNDVPLWALFEVMTMGDIGFLFSCLTPEIRKTISKEIGFNLSVDTNLTLLYKYLYTLKDLRNAVAHNAVVFDTRFRKIDPTLPMKKCLQFDIKLPYVNFKTIGDYIILVCYFLKLLEVPSAEIVSFVQAFEQIVDEFSKSVDLSISSMVIHPDLTDRMQKLKNFI